MRRAWSTALLHRAQRDPTRRLRGLHVIAAVAQSEFVVFQRAIGLLDGFLVQWPGRPQTGTKGETPYQEERVPE